MRFWQPSMQNPNYQLHNWANYRKKSQIFSSLQVGVQVLA
jgi:hypothetical protein